MQDVFYILVHIYTCVAVAVHGLKGDVMNQLSVNQLSVCVGHVANNVDKFSFWGALLAHGMKGIDEIWFGELGQFEKSAILWFSASDNARAAILLLHNQELKAVTYYGRPLSASYTVTSNPEASTYTPGSSSSCQEEHY